MSYEAFMTLATDILRRVPEKEEVQQPQQKQGGFNLDDYTSKFNNNGAGCC